MNLTFVISSFITSSGLSISLFNLDFPPIWKVHSQEKFRPNLDQFEAENDKSIMLKNKIAPNDCFKRQNLLQKKIIPLEVIGRAVCENAKKLHCRN